MVLRKTGRQNKPRGQEKTKEVFDNLAPLGRFGVPFWRPLDFEGVPKSVVFVQDQHKSQKNGN